MKVDAKALRQHALATLDVSAQHGDELQILCPAHDDHSPSASLNIRKGVWICYACGAKGMAKDLFGQDFVSYEIDWETITMLLDSMDKDPGPKVLPESWLDQFDNHDQIISYWVNTRGIPGPVVDQFCLGWDISTNAAVIPMRDPKGGLVGVTRRFMEGKKRYMYPAHFPVSEYLYAYDQARRFLLDREAPIVLTEGAIDAMAVWAVGIPAVAIYGSRISDPQVDLINAMDPSYVVTAFDMDRAGEMARHQVIHSGLNAPVFDARWTPDLGKDMDEVPINFRTDIIDKAVWALVD